MNSNNEIIRVEADSQAETVENLLEDLDIENGSWSPLFPTEEEYNPFMPQIDMPDHDTVLQQIPLDAICRYVGHTTNRITAGAQIDRLQRANTQAELVDEIFQKTEGERREAFLRRQVGILERETMESKRKSAETEEQCERQLDYINLSEERHRQEIEGTRLRIYELEKQVYVGLQRAIEAEEQNYRQLDYLNRMEQGYCQETERKDAKIRELEWTLESRSNLTNWAKLRARRARKPLSRKYLL